MKKKKSGSVDILFKIWLGITMVILFLPIFIIILMSFNTSKYGTLPFVFTLQWYVKMLEATDLIDSLILSLWFSALVSTTAAVLGVMASLALRKLSKIWNKTFPTLMNIPVIVPWLVQGVALLLMFNWLGIGRSFLSMFIGNLIAVMPHSFLLTYSRVMTISPYPEEAARTLGAGGLRVFKDVTFQMIFPSVLAGWLMSYVLCFNCFALQYYLAPFGTYTLPMRIFTLIRSGCEPDVNALATIICLVTFLAIFLLGKTSFNVGQLVGIGTREDK